MNVQMGTNATLSWSQISNQPNAATLGGLMENSTRLTHISSTGLYTGTISADQITAGKIKADYIDTANLAAQKIYQKDYPNNYMKIGGQFGSLELYYNNTNYFTFNNGIDYTSLKHFDKEYLIFSGALETAMPVGKWDFANANVVGLYAKFA